ncbi:MAG TPA: hypothetical protein ACFYEK_11000 [Candidatus Wunengus sp. YC60]|uniref:hypothetical protein n=1 Tax=Candidatus Wunengus sp. YC60 TaxID=3367697 RepID=UPI004025EB33
MKLTMHCRDINPILHALNDFSSVKDHRPNLEGVWLEAKGGKIMAYATNGRILGMVPLESPDIIQEIDIAEDACYFLPSTLIEQLNKKKLKKNEYIQLEITINGTITVREQIFSGMDCLKDSVYTATTDINDMPPIHAVLDPRLAFGNGEAINTVSLNASYLSMFENLSSAVYHNKYVTLNFDGQKGAIRVTTNFIDRESKDIGLLMPVKISN